MSWSRCPAMRSRSSSVRSPHFSRTLPLRMFQLPFISCEFMVFSFAVDGQKRKRPACAGRLQSQLSCCLVAAITEHRAAMSGVGVTELRQGLELVLGHVDDDFAAAVAD